MGKPTDSNFTSTMAQLSIRSAICSRDKNVLPWLTECFYLICVAGRQCQ